MTYSPPITSGTIEAYVDTYPHCDLCGKPAWYDAYGHEIKTWAYFCPTHAEENMIRLGTGCGQRLVRR